METHQNLDDNHSQHLKSLSFKIHFHNDLKYVYQIKGPIIMLLFTFLSHFGAQPTKVPYPGVSQL